MIKLFVLCIFYQTLVLDLVGAQNGGQSNCTSPNGTVGWCIGLRQCPQLLSILQTSRPTSEEIEFLRRSTCGFDGKNPRVCCTIQNQNPNGVNDANLEFNLSSNPLLPSDCGRQLSQRIVGGEFTDLGEFPWMALLMYETPNGETAACGGALINHRYILTAAHCLKGKHISKGWSLKNVRLGEYDVTTNPDCIKKDDNSKVCADDVVTADIEEQIPNESYDPIRGNRRYDIALLRLNRDIPYTKYIQPICLPHNAVTGTTFVVAGWGTTETASSSDIIKKVSVPLFNKQDCVQKYKTISVNIGYGQICAGGESGKDSCAGDSGGPLMDLQNGSDGVERWTTVGVVSFGPRQCGLRDWPGIYTRVIDFVPWILSKLKP